MRRLNRSKKRQTQPNCQSLNTAEEAAAVAELNRAHDDDDDDMEGEEEEEEDAR